MPAVSLDATAELGGQNRSVVVLCGDQTELSLAWASPRQLSGILSIEQQRTLYESQITSIYFNHLK